MEGDPLAVALKFGFLAVLYLFLFAVARSALKDLRGRTVIAGAEDGTGMHAVRGGRVAATDAWLVALSGAGLEIGERIDLFGGVTIGRGSEADVRIEDRFASTIHCRVHSRGNTYLVEDMSSTNGTFLNGARLDGEVKLSDLDEISIGDTTFRFELSLPDSGGGCPDAACSRGSATHRYGAPARGQRGLLLLAGPGLRGRRRYGRSPGGRGRLADRGRGVRARARRGRGPEAICERPRSGPTARSSSSPRATARARAWARP